MIDFSSLYIASAKPTVTEIPREYWQLLEVSERHKVGCMADKHTEGTQVCH